MLHYATSSSRTLHLHLNISTLADKSLMSHHFHVNPHHVYITHHAYNTYVIWRHFHSTSLSNHPHNVHTTHTTSIVHHIHPHHIYITSHYIHISHHIELHRTHDNLITPIWRHTHINFISHHTIASMSPTYQSYGVTLYNVTSLSCYITEYHAHITVYHAHTRYHITFLSDYISSTSDTSHSYTPITPHITSYPTHTHP